MKKTYFVLIFSILCLNANAQLDDTGSTSNGTMTLGTGTGTFYQFAGDQRGTDGTNQSQGGFGILSGSSQISPIIWMYGAGGKNAFQVKKKGYNSTVQSGATLFHVDVNGNVGIGTTSPSEPIHVLDAASGAFTFGRPGSEMNNRLTLDASSGYENQIYFRSRPGRIFTSSSQNLTLGNSQTSNSIVISGSNGRVGIGETTPDFPLQIRTPLETSDPVSYALDITRENDGMRGLSFGMATDNSFAVIGAHNADLKLGHTFGTGSGGQPNFFPDITIKHNDQGVGRVGIGTTTPDSDAVLTVKGSIHSTELKVLANAGSVPDYVFESDYELRTLKETKEYIIANKHLPEIPSAKEMEADGVDLGDMNMRLLKKIEELTLYVIEQNEQIKRLQASNARIDELERKIERLNKN